MAVSMYARDAETGRPVLFYIQVVCLAACVVVIMLIGFFWASQRSGRSDISGGHPGPQRRGLVRGSVHRGAFTVGRSRSRPRSCWTARLVRGTRGGCYLNVFAGVLSSSGADPVLQARPFSQNGFCGLLCAGGRVLPLDGHPVGDGHPAVNARARCWRGPSISQHTVAADTAKTPVPHDGGRGPGEPVYAPGASGC